MNKYHPNFVVQEHISSAISVQPTLVLIYYAKIKSGKCKATINEQKNIVRFMK